MPATSSGKAGVLTTCEGAERGVRGTGRGVDVVASTSKFLSHWSCGGSRIISCADSGRSDTGSTTKESIKK